MKQRVNHATQQGGYYNDTDQFCCEWLQRLIDAGEIPAGKVDQRSITDVEPKDLVGYEQCHFFCGVAGWPLALRLAGWSGPVWTGSCPCQPYSAAGKGQGDSDPRNLWPAFFRLIRECHPPVVFGEQVSAAIRHGWLDGICTDLEAEGYAVGAAVLGAHSTGAPHIRQRLYWVAYCESTRLEGSKWVRESSVFTDDGGIDRLADAEHSEPRLRDGQEREAEQRRHRPAIDRDVSGLGETSQRGLGIDGSTSGDSGHVAQPEPDGGLGNSASNNQQRVSVATMHGQWESIGGSSWDHYRIVHCRDGKARRVSSQSGDEPLASGIPRKLGPELAGLRGMAKDARRNRVGRLQGYGNALCIPVALEFIKAFMET